MATIQGSRRDTLRREIPASLAIVVSDGQQVFLALARFVNAHIMARSASLVLECSSMPWMALKLIGSSFCAVRRIGVCEFAGDVWAATTCCSTYRAQVANVAARQWQEYGDRVLLAVVTECNHVTPLPRAIAPTVPPPRRPSDPDTRAKTAGISDAAPESRPADGGRRSESIRR